MSNRAAPFVCMGVTLTLCALISHLPSGVPLTATQAAHELPFDFATRQPIVPVKVNGGAPVPFVVDTGASIHVLDREVAKQAKIASRQPAKMSGGGQAAVAAEFVDGLTFEAGGSPGSSSVRPWPASGIRTKSISPDCSRAEPDALQRHSSHSRLRRCSSSNRPRTSRLPRRCRSHSSYRKPPIVRATWTPARRHRGATHSRYRREPVRLFEPAVRLCPPLLETMTDASSSDWPAAL